MLDFQTALIYNSQKMHLTFHSIDISQAHLSISRRLMISLMVSVKQLKRQSREELLNGLRNKRSWRTLVRAIKKKTQSKLNYDHLYTFAKN